MSDDRRRRDDTTERWRRLPARPRPQDLVTGQEVPPKPQVVADPGNVALDEATRYPV